MGRVYEETKVEKMITKHIVEIEAKDNTSRGINNVEKRLNKMNKAAAFGKKAMLGIGAAGLAAGAVGVAAINNTINKLDALGKAAQAASITSTAGFERFQVIRQYADEAGITNGELDRAFRNLNTRLLEGSKGTGSYADVFAKLSDRVLDANGNLKEAPFLFDEVNRALEEGVIDGAEFAKIMGQMVGPKVAGALAEAAAAGKTYNEVMADAAANAVIVDKATVDSAEAFKDTIGRISNALTNEFYAALAPLIPILEKFAVELLANLPGYIENAKAGFEAMAPVMEILGSAFEAISSLVNNVLIPAFNLIAPILMPLVELVGGSLVASFQTLADIFRGDFSSSIGVIKTRFDETIEFLKTLPEQFLTLGIDIVAGLVNGLKEGADQIKDAVLSPIKEAYSRARSFLESRSPSRLMMGMAEDMIDGLTIGVNNAKPDFLKSMDNLMTEGVSKAQSFGDEITSAFDSAWQDGKFSFKSFSNSLLTDLGNLVAEAIYKANPLGELFGGGGIGGALSSVGSAIGDIFAGAFDSGGYIPGGKVGLVGENGPELVSGPAMVTSRKDTENMMGSGEQIIVNYSPVIQAIDTQTGIEFLAKNQKSLVGIIDNARNRKGLGGITR